MAIETVTTEGDFVIKNASGGDLLRVHCGEDGMSFTVSRPVISFTLTEADELRGWIQRRLQEPVRN